VFYLNKTYEKEIVNIAVVAKEDLEMVNHLSGKTNKFLKLSFRNVSDLMSVRLELMPLIRKNQDQR